MATHRPLPPLERLHELLVYEAETGVLRWRVMRNLNNATAGSVAGSDNGSGYLQVMIDGVRYKAHRLAYYMGTGSDPGEWEIDHIDRDRCNNRLNNLRLADRSLNSTNRINKHRPVAIACPDGLLLQCPSVAAAAQHLLCDRNTIRRHLQRGTPTSTGHRIYNYPRTPLLLGTA